MKNKITKIAKIIRIIGIIISIVSIVWGAFLMHYIFGMFILGFSTFSVGMFITEYYDW